MESIEEATELEKRQIRVLNALDDDPQWNPLVLLDREVRIDRCQSSSW